MNGTSPLATRQGQTPRGSRLVSGAMLGIVVLVVPLAAAGCSNAPSATAGAPSASAVASEEAASPVPSGITLLDMSGTGNGTSEPFHASGSSVQVTWTFDCAAASGGQGTFAAYYYGAEASPALADELTNGFAASGSDGTSQPLNGNTGPFTVEIQSDCSWSLKVIGAP